MNIVLYSNTILPNLGGRELVVHYIAKSLTELGHKVRVISPSGIWRYRNIDMGYKVHRYFAIVRGGRIVDQDFKAEIREKTMRAQLSFDVAFWGADIIHAHATYPGGYIAAQIKRKGNRIPLVITPHGVDIHTIPEINHGMRLHPKMNPKIEFALEKADALTSIAEGIENSILDAGTPKEKIYSVPNGVDVNRFSRTHTINVWDWLKVPPNTQLVVSVGNYHPRKGQDVLVRSFPEVLAKNENARLVIIGNKTEILHDLVKELGIEGKAIIVGGIPFPIGVEAEKNDVLAAIYANSSVYVSAGIDEGSEGLSLALLEAMAASLPVIGTNISGNRDIIEDGVNGYLVKPADTLELSDKIIRILSDTEASKKMAKESFSVANKYHWHDVAREYIKVYEKVLQDRQ